MSINFICTLILLLGAFGVWMYVECKKGQV